MNGDFVTARELEANLKPVREDIAEIKTDVKQLIALQGDTWLGKRGRSLLDTVLVGAMVTIVSGAVSAGVVLLVH